MALRGIQFSPDSFICREHLQIRSSTTYPLATNTRNIAALVQGAITYLKVKVVIQIVSRLP